MWEDGCVAGKMVERKEKWGYGGRDGGVTGGIEVRQVGWGCHERAGSKTVPMWEWQEG